MASIVRTELELKCRELKLDTNKSIRESDRSVVALMTDDQYVAIHDQSDRMRRLFAAFGLTDEHLEYFADEANARQNPMHSQTRTMPPFAAPAPKRGPGRPRKNKSPAADADKPKRGRGRPKGSKNKKTLEKEAQQANMPPVPKRKPGRPKGSKNKKTLAKEAAAATVKRGRGRPRGSKNKKTLERERLQAEQAKAAKKKK